MTTSTKFLKYAWILFIIYPIFFLVYNGITWAGIYQFKPYFNLFYIFPLLFVILVIAILYHIYSMHKTLRRSFVDILLNLILLIFTTIDRKSTRLNSSHVSQSRMPSSA